MQMEMGHTSIVCQSCGVMIAVKNESLESMTEFSCPSCGMKMTDYEFSVLKAHYYTLLAQMFNNHCGAVKPFRLFTYNINLWPHYEAKQSEQNETD